MHAAPLCEWIQIWRDTKSIDPAEYPLSACGGPFTEGARRACLESVQTASGRLWPENTRSASSEIDGLCAFRRAELALQWGIEARLGAHRRELYVVLSGEDVGKCAEEESVVVKFCGRSGWSDGPKRMSRARHRCGGRLRTSHCRLTAALWSAREARILCDASAAERYAS